MTTKETEDNPEGNQMKLLPDKREILLAFAKYDPCHYKGAILCDECPEANCDDPCRDTCDMYHGRKGHQDAFMAGVEYLKAKLEKP